MGFSQMLFTATCVGLMALFSVPPTMTQTLSADEQQAIVDKHNSLRAAQESSDMQFMKWNDALAEMAKLWADKCIDEHGQPSYDNPPYKQIGQNLFWFSGETLNPLNGVQVWYDEIDNYDYSTLTCAAGKMCGHYTQVVWADSVEVGCAWTSCGSRSFLFCNYGPPGNYVGDKPFKKGAACTQCKNGEMTCDGGLCRSKADCEKAGASCSCEASEKSCTNGAKPTAECTCECPPGYWGGDCSDKCVELSSNCGTSWPSFTCTMKQYPFIYANCPVMCGRCKSYTQCKAVKENTDFCKNGGTPDTQSCVCNCPTGFWKADCSADCNETDEATCKRWKSEGQCKWPTYVDQCPKTCGKCQ